MILKTGEVKESTHYLITSMDAASATPRQILAHCRKQWGIENCLFRVKDDSFGEDHHVMASHQSGAVKSLLRATALGLLRGRSALWSDKDPLAGWAQAVHASPLQVISRL